MSNREQELRSIKQHYGIVGNCEALNRALEMAMKVAKADVAVLIQGENGVGKEIIPRIIHDLHQTRRSKKYLAVNCGAIPEGTLESELFGHTEGAYTGSVGKREGYFATADGGTLFLDEVGELPLQVQVRLLRVLETGEYIPVGSSEPRKTNVRVIAATNVNMQRAIAEGRFREDLYYRLSAISISVPPLRERGKDIDMLFRKFALDNQEKYHIPPVRLNEEARQMLLEYPWPGNVRQLKNVVDSMTILCDEREITPDILSRFIPAELAHTQIVATAPSTLPAVTTGFTQDRDLELLLQQFQLLAKHVTELTHDVEELKLKVHELTEYNQKSDGSSHLFIPGKSHFKTDVEDYEEIIEEIEGETAHQGSTEESRPQTKQELEKKMIIEALARNKNNRRAAAQECNISERTLYRKINEYGIL